MVQQVINLGAVPDDGDGDPLRTAFEKTNDNFTELYTPEPWVLINLTVTAQAGALVTYSAFMQYSRVGDTVNFTVQVFLQDIGTATGFLYCALPFFSPNNNFSQVFVGRETSASGVMLMGVLDPNASNMVILTYLNASPIANGANLVVTGTCRAA